MLRNQNIKKFTKRNVIQVYMTSLEMKVIPTACVLSLKIILNCSKYGLTTALVNPIGCVVTPVSQTKLLVIVM